MATHVMNTQLPIDDPSDPLDLSTARSPMLSTPLDDPTSIPGFEDEADAMDNNADEEPIVDLYAAGHTVIRGKLSELPQFGKLAPQTQVKSEDQKEYTGGSVSYYKVLVENPTTAKVPYTAECNDIIEALGMNFAEGNAFKAIWRLAAARKGTSKRGYTDGKYDAEKVVFFGQRMVIQNTSK